MLKYVFILLLPTGLLAAQEAHSLAYEADVTIKEITIDSTIVSFRERKYFRMANNDYPIGKEYAMILEFMHSGIGIVPVKVHASIQTQKQWFKDLEIARFNLINEGFKILDISLYNEEND